MQKENHLKGILLILLSSLFLSLLNTNVTYLTTVHEIDTFQITFFTTVSGMLVLLPTAILHKFRIDYKSFRLAGMQAIFGFMAAILVFYSFQALPLSFATSITMVGPIMTTILSALVLKEKVSKNVKCVLICGFVGMLIVVQPSEFSNSVYTMTMLGGVLLWSCIDIILKVISGTKISLSVQTFYLLILQLIAATGALCLFSSFPTDLKVEVYMLLCLSGILYSVQILTCLHAFSYTYLHYLTPFYFMTLVISSILEYFVLDNIITYTSLIGSAIIVASATYIAYSHHRK